MVIHTDPDDVKTLVAELLSRDPSCWTIDDELSDRPLTHEEIETIKRTSSSSPSLREVLEELKIQLGSK